MVMRDVACAGYVAGGNCRFFAEDEDGKYKSEACNANLMSRLSFDDDVTDKYASMLAFPAMEGQFKGGQLDTCMSVTTRVLPWEVQNNTTHDSFPGGDNMFRAYEGLINLKQIHYGEDMKAAENQDFISQARLPAPAPRHAAAPSRTHSPLRLFGRRARPTTPRASSVRRRPNPWPGTRPWP